MVKNSNKLFEDFDFEKSKVLVQRWKTKEDFFNYYNSIKNPEQKFTLFNRIKNLFVINYGKKFMDENKAVYLKKIWSIKKLYFRTALILPIILLSAIISSVILIFAVPKIFPTMFTFKIIFLIVPSVCYFLGIILLIYLYKKKISKLPIKEIKFIVNGFKNLQNHFFEFSNKSEIIRFMKLNEPPKKLFFFWDDKDFKLFSILYSREIYNRVNHSLNWSPANYFYHNPIKIQKLSLKQRIFYNFYAPKFRKWIGFLNPWLKLKKFNDKEIMLEKSDNELLYGCDLPIIEEKRWKLSQESQLPVAKFSKNKYENFFFKNLKTEIIVVSVYFHIIQFFFIFGVIINILHHI